MISNAECSWSRLEWWSPLTAGRVMKYLSGNQHVDPLVHKGGIPVVKNKKMLEPALNTSDTSALKNNKMKSKGQLNNYQPSCAKGFYSSGHGVTTSIPYFYFHLSMFFYLSIKILYYFSFIPLIIVDFCIQVKPCKDL